MFHFFTYWLEPLACLLYLTIFIIKYVRHKEPPTLALCACYLINTSLLTLAAVFTLITHTSKTTWLYEVAALSTSICFGYYFYHILQSRPKKKTVAVLVTAYVLYALYRNLTLEPPRLFDSIGYSIMSASITVYVFMYFHQVLKNVTAGSIFREFNFWLASGYLVYFLGSFIIFLSFYYLTKRLFENHNKPDADLLMALWGLHNVLLFLGALSLLIGSLWIDYRRKST